LLAGGVEQDDGCARVEFECAQRGGGGVAEFGDFDIGLVADTHDIIIDKRAGFFAACFAQHQEADFHELIFFRLARSFRKCGSIQTEFNRVGQSST